MHLRQLLNLGIMSVNPGTIQWEEDHFETDSLDISGVKIKGKLIVENDRVSKMKLFYNEFPYLIEYAYSNKLSVPIPDRFLVTYLGGGNSEFRYEFEILTIGTSPEPLGPQFFDPSDGAGTILVGENTYFVHTSAERHWVYTNGGPMRVETNGALIPLPRPAAPTPPDKSARRLAVLLGLAILTVSPIVILCVNRIRKRNGPGSQLKSEPVHF
jgi:hypothetical protein